MACLMPPSPSSAKRRAGGVMSAIKPLHNTAIVGAFTISRTGQNPQYRLFSRKQNPSTTAPPFGTLRAKGHGSRQFDPPCGRNKPGGFFYVKAPTATPPTHNRKQKESRSVNSHAPPLFLFDVSISM